jgi:SWI/SNF-related matrix-associated actin-dependent regulator 1 of chromatin subfamily A
MMLRRTAKEVDTELPDKTRQIIDVRVPANKMVMPSMSNLGDRRALRRVLDLTADAKLKPVQDLLKSHLEEGLKVIAFCHRQAFAETLVSGSVKFGVDNLFSTYVHGDVSSKNRIAKIISAEKNTGPVLFAATIESCSSAIDLSFADIIVFCELTYEPGELAQCEERSYKVGDGRKLLIQYVIARGTGDELILRAVISKLADFETIVGSTGDRMKEDLAGKKDPDAALKRLAAAMEEMHKARPVSDKKKKRAVLSA